MEDVASGLRVWIYQLMRLISEILCMRIICERDSVVCYPRAIVIIRSCVQLCVRLCAIVGIRREERAFLETTDR